MTTSEGGDVVGAGEALIVCLVVGCDFENADRRKVSEHVARKHPKCMVCGHRFLDRPTIEAHREEAGHGQDAEEDELPRRSSASLSASDPLLDLRIEYVNKLIERALEDGEMQSDLLDRIERLLGWEMAG